MKKRSALAVLGVVLVMAACSSDSPSATSAGAASSSSTSTSSSSTSSSSSSSASGSAGAALSAATNAKVGQSVLTDSSGKTVYIYVPDGTNTTSQVSAGLKGTWPPVTVTGTPTAGSGVDQTKLTAQPQPDGTTQLSYNGHLLYTFAGDSAPGDANGQALGNIWFVLSPAGEQVG